MAKVKIKIVQCPYCNGTQFVNGYQTFHGSVVSKEGSFKSQELHHKICLSCGSVVRSYVIEPEKLLKRKNRKYVTDLNRQS